jgi:hypothetical protein
MISMAVAETTERRQVVREMSIDGPTGFVAGPLLAGIIPPNPAVTEEWDLTVK